MAKRIHKGDKVVVISGSKEIKGKEGTVLQVLPKEDRVIIDGINVVKKHQKKNQEYPDGAILEKAAPLHLSKVALIDPKTKKATKIKYQIENGKKVRIAKKSGNRV